jgi:hypothetical protein
MASEDLRHLIPPDTRGRNAALLAFGCVVFGALLMRGGEELVTLRASAVGVNASHARALGTTETTLRPPLLFKRATGVGVLTVICFPACSHVYMDGRVDLGASPIWQKQVPAGTHRLRLVADGAPERLREVEVDDDELVTVKQTMTEG